MKQEKPLVENQFYIRATGHVRSLMSAGEGTIKMILAYQMEISKIFKVLEKGKKLLFTEHFRPGASKPKEHFELGVFPFEETQFEELKKEFEKAIKHYRGEQDCRTNLMRFDGQEDFVSQQKKVGVLKTLFLQINLLVSNFKL